MINMLKDWVMNISALVILLVLVEIIIPRGRIRKFIHLVSGLLMILVIIEPFIGFMKDPVRLEDVFYYNSNSMDRLEIEKSSTLIKDTQMKQITLAYRNKLKSQIEEIARKTVGVREADVEVTVQQDNTSDKYGEIEQIILHVLPEDAKSAGTGKGMRIDQIEVGKSYDAGGWRTIDPELSENLKLRISKAIEVEKERIIISMK